MKRFFSTEKTGVGKYRYGFNGKENDNEVKGTANQQDYGMRIYDPRAGRFLSVDPLTKGYPMLTPYQFASNSPIENIDLDGLEKHSVHVNGKEFAVYGPLTAEEGYRRALKSVPQIEIQTYRKNLIEAYKQQKMISDNKDKFEKLDAAIKGGELGFETMEQGFNALSFVLPRAGAPGKYGINQAKKEFDGIKNLKPTIPKRTDYENHGSEFLDGDLRMNDQPLLPKQKLTPTELGNKVHYDRLNGGEGEYLPSELSKLYPNTQFRFLRRGQKGADVEVVGGTHPSQYPGSKWDPANDYGDFKPGTPSGTKTFSREIGNGKLPENTQILPYNPNTGKLQ